MINTPSQRWASPRPNEFNDYDEQEQTFEEYLKENYFSVVEIDDGFVYHWKDEDIYFLVTHDQMDDNSYLSGNWEYDKTPISECELKEALYKVWVEL